MKFPSTNLLCCRASPPAPRRHHCGSGRGALPDLSGSVFKDRAAPVQRRRNRGAKKPSPLCPALKVSRGGSGICGARKKLSKTGPPGQPLFSLFLKKFPAPRGTPMHDHSQPTDTQRFAENAAQFKRHQKARKTFRDGQNLFQNHGGGVILLPSTLIYTPKPPVCVEGAGGNPAPVFMQVHGRQQLAFFPKCAVLPSHMEKPASRV